uniref:Uncharacterized protein n=1 Tax=Chromera velia CCMP2878 TaxID=1169474 RepID=A0A0G4HJL6_9ALVE|mmetsp:Transcript_34366/g.67942  ORF Transcript_34366/g.67942 Transcript_34366/m.67942 type:complete len:694 (+) Transcript_34366:346-2427(+)|eukprot:Cvel_28304.t1-p1 / transcript=Cvel_28304.t1 / gene=Cvel_28304 / organism=Chromera_velia_CCMP2878 / gene_product=Cytoplasmic dynein 1 intermediate chain 2, putative / transcript_product=Cytoplasmic dynein 1 intermediate chain 2, putative / location=Cvel_scaffold3675:1923-12219(+) / protein_length=693 / sequence_SO=supercontig / SO=protein_coding / is_pseudo=false
MDEAKRKELEELRKQRQRELAEKKKKIEELKKRRQERMALDSKSPMRNTESTIDELLQEILATPTVQPEDHKMVAQREAPDAHAAKKSTKLKRATNLGEVNIPPKILEAYDKSVQVELDPPIYRGGHEEDPGGHGHTSMQRRASTITAQRVKDKEKAAHPGGVHHSISAGQVKEHATHLDTDRERTEEQGAAGEGQEENAEEETEPQIRVMSDDDFKTVSKQPEFSDFFSKTSRLMERALGQQKFADVFVDYSGALDEDEDGEGESAERAQKVDSYFDPKWTETRPVMDVKSSPKYPELFLAAYGQKENESVTDPDGCVLLWSLNLPSRPEFAFVSQSAVLSADFNKFQPNIVVGGTYSGSIVMWDTRAKAGPIQRTPLTARGHSHPVYALQLVGSQNAHNLVSISTDGRLCVWALGMLVQPQESLDFRRGANREVAATCLSLSEGETNILYTGAEDGNVFQAHIHGSKNGVTDQLEGIDTNPQTGLHRATAGHDPSLAKTPAHEGPVSALDFHPQGEAAQHGADFSDFLLSSSFDWTIKLWSPKSFSKPLHSFEASEDYVFDVKWNPQHPALFASVDGEGYVDVWDMNRDMESPYVRVRDKELALNKVCWSSDGRRIVTGDHSGVVNVWGIDKELTTAKPEDFTRLDEKISDLKPAEGALGGYGGGGYGTGGYGGDAYRNMPLSARYKAGDI